jgi:pyruvate dehydrogenase E2 component (dihydrolipoamide acetyltransferase)
MEFKFPDVGEGIAEGEIVKWLVSVGDTVKADQNIVQVETDKAVADLPAPISGKITKINFKEGETVKVGEILCVIGSEGEKVSKITGKKFDDNIKNKQGTSDQGIGKVGEDKNQDEHSRDESFVEMSHSDTMKNKTPGKAIASPAVRKLAQSLKIDLSNLKGSGEGGRILKEDLDKGENKVVEEKREQKIVVKKKYDEYGYIERVPLKGIRKTISENMMKSLSGSAQLTAMDDIDVTDLWEIRKKEKQHFEIEGIKLTFLPFIVRASILAGKENPMLNSTIEGEEILIRKYFNVGIAVETDVGLMVPVIKIAEKKSVAQIAKEIVDLAEKARTRMIDVMDMQGSTFTITNYGSVGGTYATPILNLGNSAILGLGRIFDKVFLDKKGKVRNRKILPVSLTFDHRILDGAQASRFLESLKKFLGEPGKLFEVEEDKKNPDKKV